jgi:hypothetical protein
MTTPIADALRTHGYQLYRTDLRADGGAYLFVVSPGLRWGGCVVHGPAPTAAAIEAGYLRAAREAAGHEGAVSLWLAELQAPFDLDGRLADLERRLQRLGWGQERCQHIVRCLAAEFEQ